MARRRTPPTLAQCLARGSGRAFERRLQTARYYAGIDLGTTNSSVTLVDSLALLRGDAEAAVRTLPIRQHGTRGMVESPYLASVVAEVEPGEWWVGQGAREARSRGLLRGRQIFYSTKLEMGLGREPFYPQAATPEYDAPFKVAGRILQELRKAIVEEAGEQALGSTVVTVPASFQLAARKDTFRAARLAGIELREQSLLDEPNAAFVDYVLTGRPRTDEGWHFDLTFPRNVLVFDFGGGTCDVSVLRVHSDPDEQRLHLSNLSIARYEQLGGDNVDAAIVERVLLPQLLEQNGLEPLDLTFTDKKERILPQLLSTAEALKVALCTGSVPEVPPSIRIDLPPRPKSPARTLVLEHPRLFPDDFEEVLEPFLDTDFLYPRDSELTPVASVFGPVGSALRGAALEPEDVGALLLVGGSSLIPQVEQALTGFFPEAALLAYPSRDRVLCSVSRGAALQAFFVHAFGRPLVNPIAQESLGVLTREGGYVELIPRGTELPFPTSGEPASWRGLVVPRDLMTDVQIVVAAGGPDKPLGIEHLAVPTVESADEPIDLTFRLDANKILTVRAELANHPEAHCMVLLENPLCAVAFTSERQREIAELENQLARRSPADNPARVVDRMERLACLYAEEGQHERAIDQVRASMELERRPSAYGLNLIANWYDALGAADRAEKHYREAMRVGRNEAAPRFNLCLLLERQNRIDEAVALVEEAVRLEPGAAVYRAQRAMLWRRQGREVDAHRELRTAARELDALPSLDPWRRHWRSLIAREMGDAETAARLEREGREAPAPKVAYDEHRLPGVKGALARRAS